jgi:uncharacterized alpha-E superfamily protein
MLLSRVADALYWAGRYLERAQHTARLIDVAVDLRLGRPSAPSDDVVEICGRLVLPPGVATSSRALVEVALIDASNRNSVAACVTAARENARQVRDEITSDMWEQINALFLRVRQMGRDAASKPSSDDARWIIEGVHLVEGTMDATMGHGEGWQYLQAGRFLERAVATAALLAACVVDERGRGAMRPLDRADWVAVLRSCAALEGYCRQYTADVRPERVVEFLLLNAECPRSVRFAATRIESALHALARHSGRSSGARAERLAGRLRASLDYAQVDEVLSDGPHAYLTNVGRQGAQLHAALYQAYITYPIESALPA